MLTRPPLLRQLAVTALMLPLSVCINAQENMPENAISWMASIGITFGGDDLATAKTKDGDYTEDVEGGGLVYVGGGINYRFDDTPFSMQGVLGYHFDFVDADNGDASFGRYFFDLVGSYQIGRHRLGLGATQHFNSEYEIDTNREHRTDEFEDAIGLIIEYTYMASSHVGVSIRYTDIEYDFDSSNGNVLYPDSIDGSNIGLFIHGFF